MYYVVVLTNGKTIKINADEVEYHKNERTVIFINNYHVVAKINTENVAGVIDADYIILPEKSEVQDADSN